MFQVWTRVESHLMLQLQSTFCKMVYTAILLSGLPLPMPVFKRVYTCTCRSQLTAEYLVVKHVLEGHRPVCMIVTGIYFWVQP